MSRIFRFFILSLFFAAASLPAQVVKLASPLPEGSEWDNALRQMADEWKKITNGQVQVRIYPGGIAGDESDMIRKMRFGQIDAGVFSSFGIKAMVPETFVVSLPGMIQTEKELDFVLENYIDRFDGRFREEGFEVLAWSKSGWVYIFGQTPLRTPDDLRKQSLAVGNSENEIISAFKAMKFNVVPVSINETMVSLQSGMANSFYAPPVVAAAFQWFAFGKYMTDYSLGPVIGSLVMSKRTWDRIPARYQVELKASMDRMALKFFNESNRLNAEAMSVMKKNDLKTVALNEQEIKLWDEMMLASHKTMVGEGKAIPTELYSELSNILEGLR